MNNLLIKFDREYGCDKRTGWSIAIDNSFCAELERYLIIAVLKTFYRYWFIWDKEARNKLWISQR